MNRYHHIPRILFILIALAPWQPSFAQSTPLAAPNATEYHDPASGVSFLYPKTFTLVKNEPYMFAPAITASNPSPQTSLRALLVAKSLPGVSNWPVTDFAGVEFAYDARPADSDDACRAMVQNVASTVNAIDRKTIAGVAYWHRKTGDGGMSHYTADDIYATFSQAARSCLLFDLAIHSTLAPGSLNGSNNAIKPRALSPHETATIRKSLMHIMTSVRISAPRQ